MERVGEEAAANEELKRKDCNISLKPGGHSLLESPILCAPLRSDWVESSLHNYSDTIEANDPHRYVTSLIGSEPLSTSSFSMNETGLMVEELIVGNYRTQNPALVCSPSSSWQGQWQHLHHFASGSGYKALHGDFVSQDNDKVLLRAKEQFMRMKSDIQNPNSLSRKSIDQLPEEKSPYIQARDYMISSSNTAPIGGNQLKTLSTSGFSQFFVNKMLKEKGVISGSAEAPRELGPMLNGKGVISRSTEARRELGIAILGQNDEKLGLVTKVASNSLLKSNADNDLLSSHKIYMPVPESFGDGICLREWLKPGCRKREKVESLHIFRQIVELVDSAQSQGLALQDLQPSYFYLWPMNKVIYTGSFVKKDSESATNKKRPLEHDMQAHSGLAAKQQKLSDNKNSLAHHPHFASRFSSRTKRLNKTDFDEIGSQNCGYFDIHTQNHSSYQSTFTTTGQQFLSPTAKLEEKWYISPEDLNDSCCSFSSNIYGLGVLLFELLCYFESPEVHSTVMSNLRYRILPSNFLSETPMEAGFCLWLLHPETSSRPTTREILHSELMCTSQKLHSQDDLLISTDNDEADSEILLHFLVTMKEQKQKHASKLVEDIRCLEEDLKEVEERHLRMTSSVFSQTHKACRSSRKQSLHFEGPINSNCLSQSFLKSNMNESRLSRDISQLENAYFSIRSQIRLKQTSAAGRSDKDLLFLRDRWLEVQNMNDESNKNHRSMDHLGTFFEGLCKFARYSKFEVCGTLRNGDLLNSANVICALSFDRDEEYFAAAGVSKKIKIFEFKSLMNDSIDIHYPVVEMSNKSKLSCVSWNNYIKNYLASTDYDGVVQIWDASTGRGFSRYIEHTRRAWSVDFSHTDPTKFASGSDDCSVKLWSINEKSSAVTIGNAANVCCVQFSVFSSNLLAFGSADYKVYCYDVRNTRIPWCTLAGHEKAVSYVKFLDSETLVSASTDNTLKLWDLRKSSPAGISSVACSLTFRGHTNEKNFVGLSAMDGYIVCGSETNEVYSYYRSMPMPITSHKFASIDPISGHEIGDDNGQFVSSVCWGQKSNMVVAANSTGCIKLLQMVQ